MPQAQTSHVRQTPSVLASVIPPEAVTADVAEEVVNVSSYNYSGFPDAIVLSDGSNWLGEWTPNNWDYGGQESYEGTKFLGIHTGTRFLVPFFTNITSSRTMLQRKVGETWSWDNKTILWFDYYDHSTYIYAMASSKTGNVYVGGYYIGDGSPAQDNYIFGLARSDDSGDTWTACDYTANADVYAAAAWQDEVLIWWSGATEFAYSADAGVTWVDAGDIPGDGEFSLNDMCVSNGHWFLGGSGGGSGEADTVLYTTTNPRDGWTPVTCPWSGYYPPLLAFNGSPVHLSNAGTIYSLFACNERICALGEAPFASDAQIMLSDDSGATWTEVGVDTNDDLRTSFGWDGVYIIPDPWSISVQIGAAYAFGRWWITNAEGGDSADPPMISVAGDLSNFYAHQSPLDNYNYAYMGAMISTASA